MIDDDDDEHPYGCSCPEHNDDPDYDDEPRVGTSECPGSCIPMCAWCESAHLCPDECGGGPDCPYVALAGADAVEDRTAATSRVLATIADAFTEGCALGIPVESMLLATGPRGGLIDSFCPICGPSVSIDEDGCCVHCGGAAVGDGSDMAIAALRAVGSSTLNSISADAGYVGLRLKNEWAGDERRQGPWPPTPVVYTVGHPAWTRPHSVARLGTGWAAYVHSTGFTGQEMGRRQHPDASAEQELPDIRERFATAAEAAAYAAQYKCPPMCAACIGNRVDETGETVDQAARALYPTEVGS